MIIGVHSPEFDFEKDLNNVKDAVRRYGIAYPVALDDQFVTWRNFDNRYWPAHYLIDKTGKVVYTHFGEGDYDVTENKIAYLLGSRMTGLLKPAVSTRESYSLWNLNQTSETYLGFARADKTLSPELVPDKTMSYVFPNTVEPNHWALEGEWQAKEDKIVSTAANASLRLHFNARKVFLVMGNQSPSAISLHLLLDGKPVPERSLVIVRKHTIYELLSAKQRLGGVLEVRVDKPGIELYAFTFGD